MIIKSIYVKNFRCILNETLNCEPLTAIVGANGAGKSSFLRALELFYAPAPRITDEDFYNKETENDIEISVTFKDLEENALATFSPYLDSQVLTVTRVLGLKDGRLSAKFHGEKLQNSDFSPIRSAANATALRQQYAELKNKPEYSTLPSVRSQDDALTAIREWELQHPDKCRRQRDDGQFFGFTEVAQGYLGRFTRLITIPAVRDAAEDAAEGKGHPITEILDLVIRATLANRDEIKDLKEEAQKRYDEVMASGAGKELQELKNKLTSTLQDYVPDAAVEMQWMSGGGVTITLPQATVKLVEHGYSTPVAKAGHGLQRAFILTMLQQLAAVQAEMAKKSEQAAATSTTPAEQPKPPENFMIPNLVLVIEEPELYQHPSRQRHLANVLMKLATGTIPGVAKKTQVLYSTHSPLFVGIDRFNQVRVLRKIANTGKPRQTKVVEVNGDDVARELWQACDCKDRKGNDIPMFTWATLQPRLHTIMSPLMAEGFFADVVVLVEGEDDRAAIMGAALALGYDLDSTGIAVIPADGKNSIDRPFLIFRKFQIPVYIVWDGDKGGKDAQPHENRILLRLVGCPVCDWPNGVNETSAAFESKLEDTISVEIGSDLFQNLLLKLQEEFGYTCKQDAVKNPFLFRDLLRLAAEQKKGSQTLDRIVGAIIKLKG